jgi:choline/glycine/proline betaine transport protein
MRINKVVFFASAFLILAFVFFGALFTETANAAMTDVQAFMSTYFGWFYAAAMSFFLGFAVWLLFSKYGHIRLGKPDEEPEYPYATWISMLFSAGIGIALLFFGVSEPMLYFTNPPNADPGTAEAARDAMAQTYLHWGFHGWALYVIVGLSLSFFAYRKDLPLTFRSTLHPLLGDKIFGLPGDIVEVLAVFATMFGVATSLGLGIMHVNAGLERMGVMEVTLTNQLILIATITIMATISVVSGLDRGIRRLSEVNFSLGILLMSFVFLAGPSLFLVDSFVQNYGYYLQNIVQLSFDNQAYRPEATTYSGWTFFYWGWWIAWSPFVGMFIARISRGRTIREFVLGVMLVPSTFIILWMTIFGNTGIWMELYGSGASGMAGSVEQNMFEPFYVLLDNLPLTSLTAVVATISGTIYFVTSSDSASLIIDILTSDNDPNPPVGQRIFWATTEGLVAAVLMATGGKEALRALQTASVTAALPFVFVLLAICYSLVQGLRSDPAA